MERVLVIVCTLLVAGILLALSYRYWGDGSLPGGILLICAGFTLWGGFEAYRYLSNAREELENRKAWYAKKDAAAPAHAELPLRPTPKISFEFKGFAEWAYTVNIISFLLFMSSLIFLWNAYKQRMPWAYWAGGGLLLITSILYCIGATWGHPRFFADRNGIEMTRSFMGLYTSRIRASWNEVREASLQRKYPKSRGSRLSDGPLRIDINLYRSDGSLIMRVVSPLGGNDRMERLFDAISAWTGRASGS